MNNEKVYIEGYIVGLFKETTFEEIGHRIQLANGDIVDIDNRFVHKSIEPEKVKIPQFVADWIEVAKTVYSLTGGMTYGGPGVNKWLENEDNQRTFALAWFDGYEVEKEPKYTVRMKGVSGYTTHLNKNLDSQNWFFASKNEIYGYRVKHTRKELEDAGFGEVFNSPPFEVEEVTE